MNNERVKIGSQFRKENRFCHQTWTGDDPKQFREKLGIDTPGKVLFREAEDGTIVVEQIRSPSEMRGFAKEHGESTTDKPATQLLREKREREKQERENHPSLEE